MWKCKFFVDPPLESYELTGKTYYYVDTSKLLVGAMWHPRGDDGKLIDLEIHRTKGHLTDHYWDHNAVVRLPINVALPCRYSTGDGIQVFCIDSKCHDSRGYYDGWTVSGEIPNITVHPSINIVGSYHGWLQNGVVSQDCEGRNYTLPGYVT